MRNLLITALLSLSLFSSGQSLGLSPEAVLSTMVTIRYTQDGEVVFEDLSMNVGPIQEELIKHIKQNGAKTVFKDTIVISNTPLLKSPIKAVENIRAYRCAVGNNQVVLFVVDTKSIDSEHEFWQRVLIVKE